MMKSALAMKGAKTLIDICAKVKPKETVLIVTDMFKLDVAKVIARAAAERDVEVIVSVMTPRERAGQEPPVAVAKAMKQADVVFTPVSYSITHTRAVKAATSSGARIIIMTDFTEDMLIKGGLEADFDRLKPICKKVADRLTEGKEVRVTTPRGTDLRMDIAGRKGNALYCIVGPGEFSTVPTVEANIAPVEGTANGRIVVDASVPYLGIGLIENPIYIEVVDGFITKIEGGRQADTLRANLENQGDKNAFNIAELGIGLNPKCQMIGVMLEDEGVLGTCHIGIGTNITLGGKIKAPCHYDVIMWNPRIEIDGEVILEGREVRI